MSDEDINISIGESFITAQLKKDIIITKIIDEKFPDYNSVIPKDNNKTFLIDKKVLLGAIRRVAIFSNKSTHQVALSLNIDKGFITTEDPEKSSKAKKGKFDKEGVYVKKWVPELKKVPNKFIHKPWEMELKYQQAINTIIGKDYPNPIVIHEKARASALEAFQSLKKK